MEQPITEIVDGFEYTVKAQRSRHTAAWRLVSRRELNIWLCARVLAALYWCGRLPFETLNYLRCEARAAR
jgi:hypothetical protein